MGKKIKGKTPKIKCMSGNVIKQGLLSPPQKKGSKKEKRL